jgi:hypothetical protein
MGNEPEATYNTYRVTQLTNLITLWRPDLRQATLISGLLNDTHRGCTMQPVSRSSLPLTALPLGAAATGVDATDDALATKSTPVSPAATTGTSGDTAELTPNALERAQSDYKVLKFARAASRIEDTATADRAAELKQQLATPDGLQAYLTKLSTEGVASAMLQSPVASYLAANS